MTNLLNLSSHDLKQAITLKERLERLQARLSDLLGGADTQAGPRTGKQRGISAAGRARIAAAARARWARLRKVKGAERPSNGRRQVSAAERARRSARAKARWAAIKRAGGNRL
ncbi:MAG: hypothetical protein KGS61_06875 [Verrucomicrobia bacterium]|nr:hypothetical protein [Verrucomicrobiota bacterium]